MAPPKLPGEGRAALDPLAIKTVGLFFEDARAASAREIPTRFVSWESRLSRNLSGGMATDHRDAGRNRSTRSFDPPPPAC